MSKTYYLTLPVSEEEVRALTMGDIVYVSGIVHTMRDMGHARTVEYLSKGQTPPFDLSGSCIWHAAPIVKQDENDKWHVLAAGSTTSSRFTQLGANLIERLNIRVTIGKGTMGKQAVDTMHEVGSVYLNTTGGCAAMYAQQVKEVIGVHWLDLGLPEAVWILRVENIGPLIVGIDSHDNSLFPQVRADMDRHLEQQAERLAVDLNKDYTYMPLRILGRPRG